MRCHALRFGLAGGAFAAVCCFTPVPVWILGALGLSVVLPYLDLVMLPALGICLIVAGVALWRHVDKK